MAITKRDILWFRKRLFEWFNSGNRRQFPWRNTRDPYKILISELMLRRTKAEQVSPVYSRFVKKYPDIQSLISARPKNIKERLKPLGLEWRANNLVSLVAETQELYGATLPTEKEDLLKLSGVGEYVAGAVRCFSKDIPETLIDTNIVRVIGRFFGLSLEGEARRRKDVIAAVAASVPYKRAREYNYAVIDFAALVCRPQNPKCNLCTLNARCNYFNNVVPNLEFRNDTKDC